MNAQWEVDEELADTLAAEIVKRKRQKQCRAKVTDSALARRVYGPQRDPRCRRAAAKDGYCRQHWPLVQTHHRIVDRIMEIPPRD